MMLSVALRHRLGGFLLDVSFETSGRLTALFGPSGSGKTSIINLIGGLTRPDHGRIAIDGRVLADTEARKFLPKHKRRIGYVFQDARLFPHMTVSQNLRYGRWFTPAAERYNDMGHLVEMLGIGHLLDRRPDRLSGGEKQRVAIGRALLSSPRLLLMDEPLAALDDARKAEIMPYIERLRDEIGVPIVYVSHSLGEVARLATDIVVLAEGKVAASGATSDIVQRLDLLPEAERREGGAVLDMSIADQDSAFGITVLRSAAGEIRMASVEGTIGEAVRVRIRARDVIVATERPTGLSALNILAGVIVDIAGDAGWLADIRIDCGGQTVVARITRQSVQALGLHEGQEVFAVVKTVSFDGPNIMRGALPGS